MNIYVGNLSLEITEEDLKKAFEVFGEVEAVKIIKDNDTGRSKGFGFVEMSDNADAQSAAEATNNELQTTYDTAFKAYNEKVKTLRAEFEKERQDNIKEIAAMRISVDVRFQETINVFLNQLTEEKE